MTDDGAKSVSSWKACTIALASVLFHGCGRDDAAVARRERDAPPESVAPPEPSHTETSSAETPEAALLEDDLEIERRLAMLRLPPFAVVDPAPTSDDVRVYSGRVVTPARTPIAGVRVRAIGIPSGSPEEIRPQVFSAVVTGASGAFRVTMPRDRGSHRPTYGAYVVFEGEGMGRTFAVDRPGKVFPEVRLASTRRVRVELQCAELFEEHIYAFPFVTVLWHRPGRRASGEEEEDVWTSRVLVPEGIEWPEPMLAGYDVFRGPVPHATRRFAAEIALPIGATTLQLGSPCGHAAPVDIVVVGEGNLPPVRFSLPAPDSATLEVRLVGPPEPPGLTHATRYDVEVWSGDFSRNLIVTQEEPARARGIPPGLYHIGNRDRARCQRTVQLDPRGTARVDVDVESCIPTFRHPFL